MAKTQMAMNVCNKTKVEQCLVVSVSVIVVPVFVDFLLMFFFFVVVVSGVSVPVVPVVSAVTVVIVAFIV